MGTRLRTALFVPADRPERIAKAAGYRPDAVVVDLEDAVAEAAKDQARAVALDTVAGLDTGGVRMMVRVNAIGTPWFADDVAALADVVDSVAGVLLPKARTPADVVALDRRLPRTHRAMTVLPIIETADGVLEARAIAAASPRVETLLFGTADLSAELGVEASADGDELLHARSQVVLAAAAAGRERPLDGPHLRLDDPDGLRRSARQARRLGFGGKVVIHPHQLAAVLAEFAPSDDEVAWARTVDAAFAEAEGSGQGAIRLDDGTFVDYPVARRARAILAEARAGHEA